MSARNYLIKHDEPADYTPQPDIFLPQMLIVISSSHLSYIYT